jgi:hypothetical protein
MVDFDASRGSVEGSIGVVLEGTDSDGFGETLAAGDLDLDGIDDLAVAAPYTVIDGVQLGAAWMFMGTTVGW